MNASIADQIEKVLRESTLKRLGKDTSGTIISREMINSSFATGPFGMALVEGKDTLRRFTFFKSIKGDPEQLFAGYKEVLIKHWTLLPEGERK
ncbi:MAG: hypothetical protein M1120_00625, partial [Patescibacteria group bacterium]|nr:hypothetical protein [Patescibacteria group bacterium]